MYPITKEALKALREDVRQSVRITCSPLSGDAFIITEEDLWGDFKITRGSTSSDKIELGAVVASELTFSLNNFDGKFNAYELGGAELRVEVRFETHRIPMGVFIVDKAPRKTSIIAIKALDRMARFNRPYKTELSYPTTIYQILDNACNLCNVTNAVPTDTLNADVVVPNPPTGDSLSFRQVIGWCAQLMGICLYISYDGQLHGHWYKTDTHQTEITNSDRFSGNTDYAESPIKITGCNIKASDEQGSEYLTGTDDYAFSIEGNGLVQEGMDLVEISSLIYTLRPTEYQPMKCTTYSFPHLYPLDILRFNKQPSKNLITNDKPVSSKEYVIESIIPSRVLVKGEILTMWVDVTPAKGVKKLLFYSSRGNKELASVALTPNVRQQVSVTFPMDFAVGKTPAEDIKNNQIRVYRYPQPTVLSGETTIHRIQLEVGDTATDYKPYDGADFTTYLTNTTYVLNKNSTLESKGKTKEQESLAMRGSFTPSQTRVIESQKHLLEGKISTSAQATLKLNETIANSMGLYVTTKTDETGATTTYYHDMPKLESSNTIYCRNVGGYAWTNEGWNNGNPVWHYGIDKDGDAVLRSINANKISADVITTGLLTSPTGKFSFNLDTGRVIASDALLRGAFTSKDTFRPHTIVMSSTETDTDGEVLPDFPGIRFYNNAYKIPPYARIIGRPNQQADPTEETTLGINVSNKNGNECVLSLNVSETGEASLATNAYADFSELRGCKNLRLADNGAIRYKGKTLIGVYTNYQIGSPDQNMHNNYYVPSDKAHNFFVGDKLVAYIDSTGWHNA